MKDWILARAGEDSTWNGIGWVLVSVGLVPVSAVPLIVSIGLGVVGLVGVVRKENK